MKPYQHHDPIADAGKAVPKPKQPTRYTYRGNRFASPVSISRSLFEAKRAQLKAAEKGTMPKRFVASVISIVATCIAAARGR